MKTLVIMEDDRRIAAHWSDLFEAVGHRVVLESDADAAFAAVRRTDADLVITDLLIRSHEATEPKGGGLALLHDLASLKPPAKRPVVVAITGMPTHDGLGHRLLSLLKSLGADRILTKPAAPQELVRVVQECLGEPPDAPSSQNQT